MSTLCAHKYEIRWGPAKDPSMHTCAAMMRPRTMGLNYVHLQMVMFVQRETKACGLTWCHYEKEADMICDLVWRYDSCIWLHAHWPWWLQQQWPNQCLVIAQTIKPIVRIVPWSNWFYKTNLWIYSHIPKGITRHLHWYWPQTL
jgi:hypothetical protein